MLILKRIFKQCDGGGMDRSDVAQGRDRCGSLVNVVMNLWVP